MYGQLLVGFVQVSFFMAFFTVILTFFGLFSLNDLNDLKWPRVTSEVGYEVI